MSQDPLKSPNDVGLREAFQARGSEDRPREDCPPPEVLFAGATDQLSAGELRKLIDHLALCPLCTEAWRLAEALEQVSGEVEVAPVRTAAFPARDAARGLREPSRGRFRAQHWGQALAAAALILMAAGLVFVAPRFAPEPAYRAGGPSGVVQQGPETLSRDDPRLRWSFPGPARYELTVLAADLEPIYQIRDLEEPEAVIPAEALEGLASGSELLYRVTAETPDGRRSLSETFTVRLE